MFKMNIFTKKDYIATAGLMIILQESNSRFITAITDIYIRANSVPAYFKF